jgi:hypothetical protein
MRDEGFINKRPMGQVKVIQCEPMGLMGRGEGYQYLTDVAQRFSCHLIHIINVSICIDSTLQAISNPILITR